MVVSGALNSAAIAQTPGEVANFNRYLDSHLAAFALRLWLNVADDERASRLNEEEIQKNA